MDAVAVDGVGRTAQRDGRAGGERDRRPTCQGRGEREGLPGAIGIRGTRPAVFAAAAIMNPHLVGADGQGRGHLEIHLVRIGRRGCEERAGAATAGREVDVGGRTARAAREIPPVNGDRVRAAGGGRVGPDPPRIRTIHGDGITRAFGVLRPDEEHRIRGQPGVERDGRQRPVEAENPGVRQSAVSCAALAVSDETQIAAIRGAGAGGERPARQRYRLIRIRKTGVVGDRRRVGCGRHRGDRRGEDLDAGRQRRIPRRLVNRGEVRELGAGDGSERRVEQAGRRPASGSRHAGRRTTSEHGNRLQNGTTQPTSRDMTSGDRSRISAQSLPHFSY